MTKHEVITAILEHEIKEQSKEELAMYFFDHEYDRFEKFTFDALMARYVEILKSELNNDNSTN